MKTTVNSYRAFDLEDVISGVGPPHLSYPKYDRKQCLRSMKKTKKVGCYRT